MMFFLTKEIKRYSSSFGQSAGVARQRNWTPVKMFALAATVFLCGAVAYGQSPTIVMNDQSILQPVTKRVGLNLGSISFYDTGQVLKNLIGSMNPSFEPLIDQQIWVLTTPGTSTTFTVPDKYDGVPSNYWMGATFKVVGSQSGGAEMGCSGTIASNTGPNFPRSTASDIDPVITTSVPCGAAFAAGDIVQVGMSFPSTPESWWENNQGGGWGSVAGGGKLTSNNTDLCATCGSQSLDLDATAAGATAGMNFYYDSASSFNLFVLMNGTYQITFWAKAAGGAPTLSVSSSRLSTGGFDCGTSVVALTQTWAPYTLPCTATESAKATVPGTALVGFGVKGGAVYLDNVSFQKVGDPTNTTVFRDEVFNTLKNYYNVASGGNSGLLRDWLGQNGETYANWTAPDYARKPTASGAGYFIGPAGSGQTQLSIEDYLNLCKALNAEPYLEIPVTITEQDAASLMEFLAGPSSSVGGAQRASLGQSDPWTSQFSQIHLSYCNECWNGSSFAGQSLSFRLGTPNTEYYYDYSVRAASIFAAMRSNAYYTQGAFDLVMNAQTAINWTMDSAIQRAHPDSIEIEAYSYNNVSSFANDTALWQPDFVEIYDKATDPNEPTNFYKAVNDYHSLNACGASGTAVCGVNIYEWGSGTLAGTIDQKHLDYITAGAGTGVVSALQPLLNMEYFGIQAQSYFGLAEYQNRSLNGETAKLWGISVDMGGATNLMRPQYLGISLINQSIIGSMYACPISNNLTYDFAGSSINGTAIPPGVPATDAVPYLFSFCFQNGSNRSMVLINTDITASHAVSFAGTNIPHGTVIQRQYAPSSPDLLNESPTGVASNTAVPNVSLTSATVTNMGSLVLPPDSVTALDFVSGYSTSAGTAATPTFSLLSGAYASAQVVTVSDSTPGATIYYTTDGSIPSTTSTVYTAPLTVSSTETIKAIAVLTSFNNSAEGSATYTITQESATPILSLAGGAYVGAQTVTISDATAGSTIYYTTNGSTPTTSSAVYTAAITIATTETLHAMAGGTGFANSLVAGATYIIASSAAPPSFSPAGGTYATSQIVSIKDAISGANIYFTTDGSIPTVISTKYSGTIMVGKSVTVKAIAVVAQSAKPTIKGNVLRRNDVTSSVVVASYTIKPQTSTPAFSLASGTYNGPQTITIGDNTPGASIFYTTNGATPSTASTKYNGAFTVSVSETIQAVAIYPTYTNSIFGKVNLRILNLVAAPKLSLATGIYSKVQMLQITDDTVGASIYYTTNGRAPNTGSTKYVQGIQVSQSEFVQVIAVKAGLTNSVVASATYTIPTALPSFGSGFVGSEVILNGNASLVGQSLNLTNGKPGEIGSAWFAKKVPVGQFTTDFTFQLPTSEADGFTFVIQNAPKGYWEIGAQLGYGGIEKSVAIKFDLYNSSGQGSDSTGIWSDGAVPSTPSFNMAPSGINLHNRHIFHVHLVYDGKILTQTVTDTVSNARFTHQYTVNIPAITGGSTAYVGFTGSTGAFAAVQNILAWSFSNK